MVAAPLPPNEKERLEKLNLYRILDTPPEDAFDRITRIVAETIGVPIALVSLVDEDRQWFKSKQGLDADEMPREVAFCAYTILGNELLEVEDATKDPRFADNPLVTAAPAIRFYAGAPLQTPDGLNLGTLCAVDFKPHKLSESHRQLLVDLARLVVDEMELRVALEKAMGEIAREVKQRAVMDEFLSMVTHELRTPLTSIRGSLGLLDGGALGPVPDQIRDIISIASRNVSSLLTLINDLLDFQKLGTGKLDFEFATVDGHEILCETCENLSGFAHQNDIKLKVECEGTASVVADKGRIGQMLTNIVSNAIKFSPQGETVTAIAKTDDRYLHFIIADRGEGIPEGFRDQVFERFSQAPSDSKIKGTGLGLAISKAIVDAHRGRIYFHSVLGQGTTFHIEIPLRQTVATDGTGRGHDQVPAQ